MFTYVCLGTNDLERAAAFYDAVLAPLGLKRCAGGGPDWDAVSIGWGTYGSGDEADVALWLCKPFDGNPATAGNGTMLAFAAKSWKAVDGFYAAALAAQGRSEGLPGLRPQYDADFYAAYVRDPDGNKLAAVCRGFTQPQ